MAPEKQTKILQETQRDPKLDAVLENWTKEQLRLSAKAIWEDDLSFNVPLWSQNSTCPKPDATDFVTPVVGRLEQEISTSWTGLRYVGGADISFRNDNRGEDAVATLVVLEYPSLKLLYESSRAIKLTVPYVPSFLSLRESAPLLSLIDDLRSQPQYPFPELLMVDGNGRMHPRAAGLAVVVGVESGIPTLGVGKDYYALPSPVVVAGGEWRDSQKTFKGLAKRVLQNRGEWIGIYNGSNMSEFVGAALLSSPDRNSTNPIYVSQGHKLSLETALRLAYLCSKEAKVPEPIRVADKAGRAEVERIWGGADAST